MGRSPCCSKVGLNRGPWSTEEDNLLTIYIQQHGEGQWRSLPNNAGLLRCGKSCRLRWMNYLRPGIKRGDISQDEEDLIVRLHGLLGNRWSLIAGRLPGRTDNEIKNYWNTHLLKKLNRSGIHPKTHKDLPKNTKLKKSVANGNKKKKPKKAENTVANNENGADCAVSVANNKNGDETVVIVAKTENGDERIVNDLPKTKVYLPKAVRVSSGFSRTSSYDSITSSIEGGGGVGGDAAEMVAWPPLFEVCGGGDEDDFLGVGCVLPLDNYMMEQVYDEYLQLL